MANSDNAPPHRPFRDFYSHVQSAEHAEYRRRPHSKVRDAAEFDRQRQHLLSFYSGADVKHSFIDENGQCFDCMPIEQQPALRGTGRTLAQPPVVPVRLGAPSPQAGVSSLTPPLHPDKKDRYGNAMSCPPGTVAIRRLTLDELTRFETLEHFLRKTPRRFGRSPSSAMPNAAGAAGPPHEYAHAWQTVDNLGGHSVLNIWAPPVTGDQIFSLSQHWYVANSAAGVQTAEVGWQVFPQKYGHDKPVLFTYWTADGYRTTGSYSTDAHDFVQYSSTCPVGIAFDAVSVSGGLQAEAEVCFLLSGGNWWLFINGTDAAHAVGYYPVSLYKGGPMSTKAAEIDYGGETVGTTTYPPMGSGGFAAAGAGRAAYQRNIYYFTSSSGAEAAALTPAQEWAASYTIDLRQSDDWGQFFYFGGPGGPPAPTV
jgi:hypothetical protein